MHPLRGVVAGGNRREIFAGVMTLILLAFTQARGPSDITLPLCSSTDPLQFLPLEVKEPAAIDPFPSDWEISTRSWMPSSLEGRVTRSLDFFDLLTVPKQSPPLRERVQPMRFFYPACLWHFARVAFSIGFMVWGCAGDGSGLDTYVSTCGMLPLAGGGGVWK